MGPPKVGRPYLSLEQKETSHVLLFLVFFV